MKRPSTITFGAISIMLALVGNIAAGAVDVASGGKIWVWVATGSLAAAVIAIEVDRNTRGNGGAGVTSDLGDVRKRLARSIQNQWQDEWAHRGLADPIALPLRWKAVDSYLMDHWSNVRKLPINRLGAPLRLDGQLNDILQVYRRIPSGRLVILGQAGSGKTILAIRFLLDQIAHQSGSVGLPVLFTLGSWDPVRNSLQYWLAEQLIRDHPGLSSMSSSGESLASTLVSEGAILPILDGFDEISSELRAKALKALNATDMPMVVTARLEEYEATARESDVLTAAAAVVIRDLDMRDFANYLRRSSPKRYGSDGHNETVWDAVFRSLEQRPTAGQSTRLIQAFSVPLIVGLARIVYGESRSRDPAELLDSQRFSKPSDIQDHILKEFIPAAYQNFSPQRNAVAARRNWGPQDAQRWHSSLAFHLTQLGTADIAWWRLQSDNSRFQRMLTFGFVGLVVTSAAGALTHNLSRMITLGVAAGMTFGLAYSSPQPSRTRVRIRGRQTGLLRGIGFGVVAGVAGGVSGGIAGALAGYFAAGGLLNEAIVGLIGGLVAGLTLRMPTGVAGGFVGGVASGLLSGTASGIGVGTSVGLAAGVLGGIVAALADPIDIALAVSPRDLREADRKNAILQLFFGGVVLGGTASILGGLRLGFAVALVGGVAVALSSSWAHWVLISRFWLPLSGRLPWATVQFLEDAYQRGVLRQAGSVYQFRHARIQQLLAEAHISQ